MKRKFNSYIPKDNTKKGTVNFEIGQDDVLEENSIETIENSSEKECRIKPKKETVDSRFGKKAGKSKSRKPAVRSIYISCRIDEKTAADIEKRAKEKNISKSEEIRERMQNGPKQIEKYKRIITPYQIRSEELIRYIEEKYDSTEDDGLRQRKEALCELMK